MKKKIVGWLSGVAALVLATSASAALVTFDLRGNNGNIGNPYTFSSGGHDMTARAQVASGSGWSTSRNLYQTSNGLGVYGGWLDSTQIDGNGADESIRFSFGSSVTLVSAWLGSLGGNDDFNLAVYNNGWTTVLDDATSLGGSYTGTHFRFWADHSSDDFYVRGLRFDIAAVPEPATLALLGLGIIAVGISRRQS